MTGAAADSSEHGETSERPAGWASVKREIAVAVGLVAALAVAMGFVFGLPAASTVVLFGVGVALVAIRTLIGSYNHQPPPPVLHEDTPTTSFVGFWRTQTDLADALSSMSAWDFGTRRRLSNLLAARLAERHGVSLADDPERARQIFLGLDGRDGHDGHDGHDGQPGARGADLWYWIDPERPVPPDASSRPGIPPKVLTALIHRLEQL